MFKHLSPLLNKIINGRTKYSSYQYNAPKEIGSVSKIINSHNFGTIDDYIEYYHLNYLNDYQLKIYSVKIFNEVGHYFSNDGVLPKFIYEYLKDLIFTKTWNGIIIKENAAILYLKKHGCKNVILSSCVDSMIDEKYAIDIFATWKNLKFGVQVKPETFLSKKYIFHYQRNLMKNLSYMELYPLKIDRIAYIYASNKNIFDPSKSTYFNVDTIRIEIKRLSNILED